MRKRISIILFLIPFGPTWCFGQNNEANNYAKALTSNTQFYFPLEAFRDSSYYIGRDTFVVSWYSKHLLAMQEPVVYTDTAQKETYRFTWLRTFHNPIAIRIEKDGDSYQLYWKLCDGAGGYNPGKLKIAKQKTIDKATWDKFQSCLNQIDFWNIPPNEKELSGYDGSQWILEGKMSNQYQVVDRWSPDQNTQYYKCCTFLIRLTNLKIPLRDKY